MRARSQKCWLTDLEKAIANLERPAGADIPKALRIPTKFGKLTTTLVDAMVKATEDLAKGWLQFKIDTTYRTYLLQGRLEPQPHPEPAKYRTLAVRHYLHLRITKHRKALTRLLLSDHPLALEQLRREDSHYFVPRMERLCRLCSRKVESPEHAILLCKTEPELVALRLEALEEIGKELHGLQPRLQSLHEDNETDAVAVLILLIVQDVCLPRVAELIYDVLEFFKSRRLPRRRRTAQTRISSSITRDQAPPESDSDSDSDSGEE